MSAVSSPAVKATATLNGHRHPQETDDPVNREALLRLRHTGLPPEELYQQSLRLTEFDLAHFHHAVADCFSEWQHVGTFGCGDHEYAPFIADYRLVQIRPGVFQEYLSDGVSVLKNPSGVTRLIRVSESETMNDERAYSVACLGPATERKQVQQEMELLRAWMRENHYLKGQAIRADGSLLTTDGKMTWDDVALNRTVRRTVIQNTVGVIERADLFKKLGIPLKRGVLLHGPPGTGKTMIGKILAASGVSTLVYLTAADGSNAGIIRRAFDLARRLQPTIVFLEDLDLFASHRKYGRGISLGELLGQMDGLENNEGLIFVATTNCPEAIEPALKERPSRFDVVLEIGLPEKVERRLILERNVHANAFSRDLLDDATEDTEGLTGAQVREVAYLAVQQAVMRTPLEADTPESPSSGDLRSAIEHVGGRKKRRIGFGYGTTSQLEADGRNPRRD